MNTVAFENLELIPALIEQNKILLERLNKLIPKLDTKKEVANFLNVSTRTINTYMEDGRFIEGYHFYRKGAKLLVFIEDAVIEFRNTPRREIA